MEVAGIKFGIPNSLIDPPEVTDGELRRAEAGGDRGVLKPGSCQRYGVSDDLVVVDTPDALLVCRKDQTQRVKEVLERLRADPDRRNYT